MAIHHTCDICGKELPDDPKDQCYIKVGRKINNRHVESDLLSIECHVNCLETIFEYINVKRNFNGLEDLNMGD